MKRFLVLIGPRGTPRLRFEAMAPDSCTCTLQHVDLVEPGERMEIRAL